MINENPKEYLERLRYQEEKEHLDDVFATKLDVFKSVASPYVSGQIYLWDLLKTIRYNIQPTIMLLPKYITDKDGNVRKNPPYEEYKEQMEAVCYPATYNGYKKLSNLKVITNLMFLDVDDFKSKREAERYRDSVAFKYDWIVFCTLSPSRKGLHILIKVDKIVNNADYNFKYDYISKEYFDGRLDKQAKSLSRYTIIPFDGDPYINEVPTTLPIDRILNNDKKDPIDSKPGYASSGNTTQFDLESVPTSLQKREGSVSKNWVQFNNFRELEGYDEQGIKFSPQKDIIVVEARIGVGLQSGHRNTVLSSFGNNLLWLNPWISEDVFSKIIFTVNEKCFVEPLGYKEVVKIIQNKLNLLSKEELRAIYTRRMIVFHPDSKLSRDDKNRIVINLLALSKTMRSREKIYAIIENWHFEIYGKISIRKIADNYPINKKTVAKYYPEFKDYIYGLNDGWVASHNN